ncbi:hypothetical protein [Clostridium botulinum]|uniref:hypothetical protein n=1 Tax=Clostridium botulinum TaxID=1491 RepID=UPI001E2AAD63|nr:hypothetical protein [Clostridium botulinum]MCD3254362.1 hypothetical protein [Clostridium botulinum C/D]MCD3279862.1 hypothetical protein [Clostridium botulinum C/D]MCD3339593.1 hypothetical protein [Clostridium botulinum C/D]MCD3357501.1 hypothetical protein [Clostridium botulinum C/D]
MKKFTRQKLLNIILKQEIKRMKRICFYYSDEKQSLLMNPIMICTENFNDKQVAGRYEVANKKNKYKFTHKIKVSKKCVDEYFNCKNERNQCAGYYKEKLISIIRHELVHAFVNEKFELWGNDIEGYQHDSSPIFLSVLYFVGGITTHKCCKAWIKSDLYKTIMRMNGYENLRLYLSKLLIDYEGAVRKIKQVQNVDGDKINVMSNVFTFGDGDVIGWKNIFSNIIDIYTTTENKKIKQVHDESNLFSIGFETKPTDINKNMIEKRKNQVNSFVVYDYKKMYVAKENLKEIFHIRHTNKLTV